MTKLHIENINITIGGSAGSNPLLAAIASIAAESNLKKRPAPAFLIPKIGEKFPGTEAIYAGKGPSRDGSKIVDLVYWPDGSNTERNYADNIAWCESVVRKANTHAATRQQAIVINDNLRHLMQKDCYYWTESKDNDGDAAFVQHFGYGTQNSSHLTGKFRALAVSEIH